MSAYDALHQFAEVERLRRDAAALEEEFQRTTRKLFTTPTGRKWLRAAMARYNFNGSVFSAEDGMDPGKAAHRDGMRNVISDILNEAFSLPANHNPEDEDDEDPHVPKPPPVR